MRRFIRRKPVLSAKGASPASLAKGLVPAAAYVRMSTDHQKYSVDNQLEAIHAYAGQRGFEIVLIYSDLGRSGVSLEGRTGLQKLLNDVAKGDVPYRALLVYDVSRWGRFQDPDEAATYELRCRKAGIAVRYCVEPFENDGSLASSVMKAMKRAMAGEYSRDLSQRTFRGQANITRLGFRAGGQAGLGFRRQLIDEQGQPRFVLKAGQHKAIATDRVVLILGPPEEVNAVRRVFRLFAVHDASELQIVKLMNAAGAPTSTPGGRWTPSFVSKILRNEKYMGNQVWARTSLKLHAKVTRNPPDSWIRCNGAYPRIVSPRLFNRAQARIRAASRAMTDEEMLAGLADLLERKGHLSGSLIDAALPFSRNHLRYRFGGLLEAYARIGYAPAANYGCVEELRSLRQLETSLRHEAVERVRAGGGACAIAARTRLLRVGSGPTVLIRVIRAKEIAGGLHRWFFNLEANPPADIAVLVCVRPRSLEVDDYYFVPRGEIRRTMLTIGAINAPSMDRFRQPSLAPLCGMLMGAKGEYRVPRYFAGPGARS
jgi:DNA invertase Pin-like site-specific DNA recombinase